MDLISQCALRVAKMVWRPGHGGFAFTVVCKATFELRPDVSPLAAEQEPVALADEYAAEGGALTVASDLVPAKKRPEVLLTGHAYAPEGRPASSVLARLVVGEIDKTIQVVGDRHFGRNGRLSDPESFTGMPLVWERADGGPDTFNPAGISLGSAARPDAIGRVPAPNLLPAGLQLKSRSDTVPPVGFGPIAPWWPSRTACLRQHAAGWDPGRWNEQSLPADIDLGYFNAAPTDQQRTLPFGDEMIYLENLHPRFAQLLTRLVQVTPAATVDQGAGPQALQFRCDTLNIDTDRGLAMLVWRAHVLLDDPDRPGRVVVTGPGRSLTSRLECAANEPDIESTLVPNAFMRLAAVLPFSGAAEVAPEQVATVRTDATPRPIDDDNCDTLVPGFNVPAAVLPFAVSQGKPVSPWVTPPDPLVQGRAPEFVPAPSPMNETPAPPSLIGAIAIVAVDSASARDSKVAAAVEAAEPEVELDFDVYPPPRCGAIAARLACAAGDAVKVGEILRSEDLDARRWQRVHAHWLARIREEAARGRKTLLSEYDGGYVGALERDRDAVGLEEYARLAEPAERGEVAGALAELGLPEEAWARIHRVWIGRMVKDVRLGKQVRAAIEARRSAG